MKRILRYSLYISLLSLLAIWGCSSSLESLGEDFFGNQSDIELVEYRIDSTFTVKIDSFATSTGSDLLSVSEIFVGRYNDPLYTGETVIIPTFQIAPPYRAVIDEYATLDSITFHFSYESGDLWGDTIDIRTQTLYLCELAALPVYNEEKDYSIFYNTTPIPKIKDTLAVTYFYPTQEGLDQTYFKLPDRDGYFANLFERMKYNDDIFSDYNLPWSFLEIFHGVALVPGENNDIIFGITATQASLYLRFHYHTGENDRQVFDYQLTNPLFQYFNVTNTPTSTFERLDYSQRRQVSFDEAGMALIQGLSGYMVKMTLPAPPPQDEYSTIVKAELELNPVTFYSDPVKMPNTINVNQSNRENELLDQIVQGGAYVTGTLNTDVQNLGASRYKIDLTTYYEVLSNYPGDTDEYSLYRQILIKVPAMAGTFDRVIIEEKPILRLYYAHYNKE